MERLLGFDAQLLFDSAVTAVNLFILFFALSYLLFNPAKAFLNKRRERIEKDIGDAAEDRRNALVMKREYEDSLRMAKGQADKILGEAQSKARKREQEILANARVQAENIKVTAEQEIERSRERAMAQLRQEVVNLAASMAIRVAAGMMDNKNQEAVIEKIVKELGDQSWQG